MNKQRRKIARGTSSHREEKRGEGGKGEGGNGGGERVGRNLRTEPRVAPASHGWGGMEGLSLRKGLHTNRVRSRGMWYPRGKKKCASWRARSTMSSSVEKLSGMTSET